MRRGLACCAAAAAIGCGGGGTPVPPALVGAWEYQGAAPDATTPPPWQRLVLGRDGRALWIVGSWALNDTFPIRFRVDARSSPAKVDLLGFEKGTLRGQTLHCIADLSRATAGSFRMDCERGQGGDAARPTAFTDRTLTYTRAR